MIDYSVDSLDMIEKGQEAAGNWKEFESFVWRRAWDLDDPDNWTIINTNSRDSDLLTQSNAAAISEEMGKFPEEDACAHGASHWAVGWVEGWEVRVFQNEAKTKVTEAFAEICKLNDALSDYPVLDEEDFSKREYEATLENISSVGGRFTKDDVSEDWAEQLFSWFWENDQSAVEPCDGQGGYPTDKQVIAGLKALNFHNEEQE
ncbi:MAG TPA: hypothetical protein VMX17_14085 [Candidatus Glassbacteria bacterium]|nr:hypothetical protein [Candidatus Glassbacteria bacterium]